MKLALLGWMVMISTAGCLVSAALAGSGPNDALRYAGVAMLLLSPVLFVPPFVILARQGGGKEGRSYMDTSSVVESGPYAIVRHPQYVGYMLLNAGFVFLTQAWPVALFGLPAIGFLAAVAVEEEGMLAQRFGEAYEEYRRRVPRFNVLAGVARRATRA